MTTSLTQPLLIIDVETTGTDPVRHACIEIGAVLLDQHLQITKEFSTLVRPWPDAELDPEAIAVHGIHSDELRAAPTIGTAVTNFSTFASLDTPPILAGWNVWFDVSFLRELYRRAQKPWVFGHRFLDVQSIAAFCARFAFRSQSSHIRDLLQESQTHRALGDALHTARILRMLASSNGTITITK